MSINSSFTDLPKNASFSSRQEAMEYLLSYPQIGKLFSQLSPSMQENLLDFYTGQAGLRITYDSVFRRLFRPDLHKNRLEQLLSAILEDHSYANIEMQKIGYQFPLARADCYASDIIMRQYSLLKSEAGERFDFNQMNKVYCIILIETSPREFHKSGGNFLHKRSSVFDTGIYQNHPGLHEDLFVCLDIFRSAVHNITDNCSPKDAWLTFLSTTNPSVISSLLENFPEFGELYRELAAFMMNPEELIAMFSEELYIMDRNTERLMVTELQDENNALRNENTALQDENSNLQGKVTDLQQELDILKLSHQGLSAEQVADTLHVSTETVTAVLNS